MKRLVALLSAALLILSLCSCSDGREGSVDVREETSEASSQSTAFTYDPDKTINADYSWTDAYALSYEYYDDKSGKSTITEGKSENYLQITDEATGIITYYEQQNGYVTVYMLNSKLKTGTVSVETNATVADTPTRFLKKSTCNPHFPQFSNVTNMGADFVAKRSATRYKQIENDEDGNLKLIAYVWIDDALGFVSRYEQYDAVTQQLQVQMELKSFTTNVTDDNVKLNLSSYSIVSE